jgi:hypothetical protein
MEPLTSTARARLLATQARGRGVHMPSRVDWPDEYFFLPDRFSDGGEVGRSLLTRQEIRDLRSRPIQDGWSWQQ